MLRSATHNFLPQTRLLLIVRRSVQTRRSVAIGCLHSWLVSSSCAVVALFVSRRESSVHQEVGENAFMSLFATCSFDGKKLRDLLALVKPWPDELRSEPDSLLFSESFLFAAEAMLEPLKMLCGYMQFIVQLLLRCSGSCSFVLVVAVVVVVAVWCFVLW